MDGLGRDGPPAGARSCWSVNGIHRNTPHRRSWPGQLRQSTTTPGVWQHTTSLHQNNRSHTSHSKHAQSQGAYRHRDVSSLSLRRSKTCADFAYTGRNGQSHQACSSLPKVHGTTRESGTAFIASSNGLADRASALKSLTNNPHLHVETVNGTTRIVRASDRRPRSLPTKFSDSPFSENTLPPDIPEPQKVRYLSKHGYHPRSKSPTYPILIGTKDTLNLALCKKLWRIRRDLEGRKARQNSVVFSEVSQAVVYEKDTDQWYEKMFDEHEQDNEEEEEDQDMAAIETLRLANPDGEFAQSDESISTVQPRPHVDLLFDKKYLKEHINDWTILGINIEEEEMKTEQRLKKASVARPTSASRKPRVPVQTATVKAKVSHRQTSFANRESKPVRTKREHRATRLPAVPTTGRVFHARDNWKKKGNRITKKPTLAQQSDEELLPDLPNGDRDSRTPSPTFEFPPKEPEPETSEDLVLDDMDRRKDLITKYLRSPKPSESPPVPKDPSEGTPDENPEKAKSPEQENEEEKPKELTEKEKFVLMRKRMEERKAKMQKRREDFLDYSMLGIRSQRRRGAGDPGAPSQSKNSLGSLMSTRLESMATFKTRKYKGEEVDEEDEDEDDGEENAEDEDEGDSEEYDS